MQEVVIGIVVKKNEVLLVQKKNSKGSPIWRFPGGKVENKESFEEALVREVKEETGIECLPLAEIATRDWQSKGLKLRFFICEYIRGFNEVNEPEIFNYVKWVSADLAEELIGQNAKTQIKKFLKWLIQEKGNEISLALQYLQEYQHLDTVKPLPNVGCPIPLVRSSAYLKRPAIGEKRSQKEILRRSQKQEESVTKKEEKQFKNS
jgi:mutator protein MutT